MEEKIINVILILASFMDHGHFLPHMFSITCLSKQEQQMKKETFYVIA